MAKDKDPLRLAQLLADAAEFEKSKKVAKSMLDLTAETRRLAVLEEYLTEYRAQRGGHAGRLDIANMRIQHDFLDALSRAVSDQDRRVSHLRQELESTLDLWRDAKSKVSALKQYTGRIDERRRRDSDRREQAALDEIATRPGTPR